MAASPVTNVLQLPESGPLLPLLIVFVAHGLSSVYPGFDYHDVLSPEAAKRWELYTELQAGDRVAFELFPGGFPLLKPGWEENAYTRNFVERTANGGKRIGGPMLVLQGLADVNMDPGTTTNALNAKVATFSESSLQYITWKGVTHLPMMYAAQRQWLAWVEDRFAGVPAPTGFSKSETASLWSYENYQPEINWFIQDATATYQLA